MLSANGPCASWPIPGMNETSCCCERLSDVLDCRRFASAAANIGDNTDGVSALPTLLPGDLWRRFGERKAAMCPSRAASIRRYMGDGSVSIGVRDRASRTHPSAWRACMWRCTDSLKSLCWITWRHKRDRLSRFARIECSCTKSSTSSCCASVTIVRVRRWWRRGWLDARSRSSSGRSGSPRIFPSTMAHRSKTKSTSSSKHSSASITSGCIRACDRRWMSLSLTMKWCAPRLISMRSVVCEVCNVGSAERSSFTVSVYPLAMA
mmetsp:Transcript_25914/g.80053  ORF Transcript_25914/g.80053 Transcript_25914/m.80053 type:complete len:264 (-) Transcript_25914:589-1380(-)